MNKTLTKLVVIMAVAMAPVLAEAGNGNHQFRHGYQQQSNYYGEQARHAGRGNHQGWRNDRRHGYGERMSRHAQPSHSYRGPAHAGRGFRHDSRDARPVRGWDKSIDRRQQRQHGRIERGVRTGELTRGEARQLSGEQRAIRQQERIYKSDGIVTRDERRDLKRDLGAANRHIAVETHDGAKRF